MSIKQEMLNGVFWGAVQKYTGVVVQLVISAVLARLVSPEDFGVMAISAVAIAFFGIFTDMGIGPAVIQNKTLTRPELESIFSFTFYTGVALSAVFFACSWPIAGFYGNVQLVVICQLLSVNLLFASLNIVPNALVLRAKRFRFIAVRSFSLQVAGGVLSVLAAFRGWGVYALLISPIVSSVALFLVNYRQNPLRLRFRIELGALRKIFGYSVFQLLFCVINYFSRNLDKLIVGRFFTLRDLGYYEKSYRLMLMPLEYVTFLLSSVMHPILSSLQDSYGELADKYGKIVRFMAFVSFTTGVTLHFAAGDAILFVFGDQWGAAIPIFKVFTWSLPLQMILSTTGAIYQASGKTNWMFYGGLSNTVCTVTGYLVATFCFGTIESIAWAWDITLALNTAVSFAVLYKVVLRAPLGPMLKQLGGPACCAAAVGLLLFSVDAVKPDWPHFLNLLVYGLVSLAVLAAAFQVAKRRGRKVI